MFGYLCDGCQHNTTFNIARYNRKMCKALWLQFAKVVLMYHLITMAVVVLTLGKTFSMIFYSLCHRRIQTQDRVQQQPRVPNALNIALYKKAVYSALWVQFALVTCYVPYSVVAILIASSETYSSQLIVSSRIVLVFVFFNSSLNPFIYCWKISEVRQAVIETIRQALCCPCS